MIPRNISKKFILFDNDGVLVDTEYWYYRATQQALSEVGVLIDLDQFMTFMVSGKTTWDLARANGVDETTTGANGVISPLLTEYSQRGNTANGVISPLLTEFVEHHLSFAWRGSCELYRDIIYILKLATSLMISGNYQSEIFLAKAAAEVLEPMIGPVPIRAE
ncbi:MAG: hypothetical protein O3C43_23200 [Verrucomicrobia bacterium]|nr:hypothetical protein [Verrucomicrobiota bacterium]MDA1069393.1 hypothetical protein [Verrucomicrobiota bacterium]